MASQVSAGEEREPQGREPKGRKPKGQKPKKRGNLFPRLALVPRHCGPRLCGPRLAPDPDLALAPILPGPRSTLSRPPCVTSVTNVAQHVSSLIKRATDWKSEALSTN